MMLLTFSPGLLLMILLLLVLMVVSVRAGKLTTAASLVGGVTGFLVWAGGGYAGIIMLATFFVLGTLATSWKKKQKAALHPQGLHPQKRNAGQVLANGGVAGLMGLLILVDKERALWYHTMLAASLASATADTLSSELGMVYGRNTFNILSFKKEPAGLDGVISLEGTLIGALGALVIASIAAAMSDQAGDITWYILIAGIGGNLTDSILGAALERKGFVNNNWVNFLNTAIAALLALLLLVIDPI
jgi:uncharacterized protein (TIGR00297 family)